MTDLVRLVYASRASFQPRTDDVSIEVNVARILLPSRKNNPRKKIGGVLYYGDGCFFQCLEGTRQAVNEVYSKISMDPRHRNVQIMSLRPIRRRRFTNWSMKYIPVEERLQALLEENGFERFDPYQFDDEMLKNLLQVFVAVSDPSGEADQDYSRGSRAQRKPRASVMRRIVGRLFGYSQMLVPAYTKIVSHRVAASGAVPSRSSLQPRSRYIGTRTARWTLVASAAAPGADLPGGRRLA